jgi:hypothetical protein
MPRKYTGKYLHVELIMQRNFKKKWFKYHTYVIIPQ